ncbi:MAG: hypothetical protein Q4A27_00380 [bacterium]|nr:hypothetical protein [bacterium]
MKKEPKTLTRRELRELREREKNASDGKNFNRNQTISSYKKEQSERLENRKLVVRRRKITGFLFALFAVSGLVLIILSQFVSTVGVKDVAGKAISKAGDYSAKIEEYYARQPIERIRSYLNVNNLLTNLQADFPEIKNIEKISMVGFGKYTFELEFRKPVASWSANDKTLYVDDSGTSFETNYFEAPELTVSDESNFETNSGAVIASNSFISFIGKAVSAANLRGIKITKITIPALSVRQVNIMVEGVNYSIKMLTTESPEGQVANLATAINYFNNKRISPEYLDLRVEGKGYYK